MLLLSTVRLCVSTISCCCRKGGTNRHLVGTRTSSTQTNYNHSCLNLADVWLAAGKIPVLISCHDRGSKSPIVKKMAIGEQHEKVTKSKHMSFGFSSSSSWHTAPSRTCWGLSAGASCHVCWGFMSCQSLGFFPGCPKCLKRHWSFFGTVVKFQYAFC